MSRNFIAIFCRKCVWIFALCCGAMVMCAGNEGFAVEFGWHFWETEDGLPHTIVQAITQTRDGYLWVGTREGLARFDGVNFTPIEFDSEVGRPSITSLCETRDGTLWIGTEKTGLFCLKGGKLSRYGLADGLKSDRATIIKEGKDGSLWVGTSHGLTLLKEGKVRFFKEISTTVWSFCPDSMGNVWVGEIGIKRVSGTTVQDCTPKQVMINSVRAVYCDPDDTLWLGQADGLIQIKNGTVSQFKKDNSLSKMVCAVLKDRAGNMWVGTYSGLCRFVDGKFTSEKDNRLASSRVYSIIEDREGNIWIGSEGGLARVTRQYFTTYSKESGLTDDRTISVCESRDKSMWIGTWGGGLNHLQDGVVTAYTKTNGLASDFVYGVHESPDGTVWIGLDYGAGLDRLKDGQITHFGEQNGLTGAPVTLISEDLQSNLWVGTRGGLFLWQEGKFSRVKGLPFQEINAICESVQGGFWMGTETGLFHRSPDGKFLPLTADGRMLKDTVFSIYEDADGTVWIGTKGNGLKRLKKGKLDSFTTREGLSSDYIYAILEDGRNNLWLSSGKGISHVDKHELEEVAAGRLHSITPFCYGKTDGVINSSQFTDAIQPAAWKSSDGRMWFRTIQGVAVVDPETVAVNQLPPPVIIEKVIADKKEVALREVPMEAKLSDSKIYAIPPGRGELEIHYTGLSFRDPQKNRFRYKLDGWDLDWIDAETRRIAYYNNLPPGDYHFRVIAANNDGVWNTTGADVAFYLKPHIWQTWWFFAIVCIFSAGCVAGVARYLTRQKMNRKLAFLEHQHALERERSRIARDIHDDLGARVTHITLLSESSGREKPEEAIANTRKIGAACREMAQSLDEIVWAVNPAHDTLEGLLEYLSQSADEFLEQTDIRLRLNTPREIPRYLISAEVRHQLFLSFREALNNVVKHAAATEIEIDLAVFDSEFQITISDNGNGFAIAAPSNGGNGLGNMRHRLEAIGGRLEVSSQPGNGSTVKMTLRLNTPQMCG